MYVYLYGGLLLSGLLVGLQVFCSFMYDLLFLQVHVCLGLCAKIVGLRVYLYLLFLQVYVCLLPMLCLQVVCLRSIYCLHMLLQHPYKMFTYIVIVQALFTCMFTYIIRVVFIMYLFVWFICLYDLCMFTYMQSGFCMFTYMLLQVYVLSLCMFIYVCGFHLIWTQYIFVGSCMFTMYIVCRFYVYLLC